MIQPKLFTQIRFTCVLQSYPQKFAKPFMHLSNSATEISILLFFFLSFFIVSHNLLMKARKNIEKSPQFSVFHEEVPFHT